MISISTSEQAQRLFIPLPSQDVAGNVALTVKSTSDEEEVTFFVDSYEVQGFLLLMVIGLPEDGFHEGEWEYTLTYTDSEGDTITATGLMAASENDADESVQYEQEITYKQYGE